MLGLDFTLVGEVMTMHFGACSRVTCFVMDAPEFSKKRNPSPGWTNS